jgi:hypothetical protein
MKNSTLLGLALGMAAGAFLVDTFQPAQDLVDNCKREVRAKVKSIAKYTKNKLHDATESQDLS